MAPKRKTPAEKEEAADEQKKAKVATSKLAIGDEIPDVELENEEGKTVSLRVS
jgi:hypothetical protein